MEPEDSPSKIATKSPYTLYLSQLSPQSILEELADAYKIHRSSNESQSTFPRLKRNLTVWVGQLARIMKEFWAQIVPEAMRGQMHLDEQGGELKTQPFADYSKLGKTFFVLVLQPSCTEQQIQESYLKATQVCPEGLNCPLENLTNTSPECRALPGLALPFRYAILFFKFDILKQLRWIGTLQKTSLEVGQETIEEMKKKLDEVVQNLEGIQKSFVGSYLEKDQRFAFEQEMLP